MKILNEYLGFLEAYLREMLQTAEFYEFMENLDIKCNTEFEGSDIYKWISILVCVGNTCRV